MRQPLSVRLRGLAEWLKAEGYEHNAAMVQEAVRLSVKHEAAKLGGRKTVKV